MYNSSSDRPVKGPLNKPRPSDFPPAIRGQSGGYVRHPETALSTHEPTPQTYESATESDESSSHGGKARWLYCCTGYIIFLVSVFVLSSLTRIGKRHHDDPAPQIGMDQPPVTSAPSFAPSFLRSPTLAPSMTEDSPSDETAETPAATKSTPAPPIAATSPPEDSEPDNSDSDAADKEAEPPTESAATTDPPETAATTPAPVVTQSSTSSQESLPPYNSDIVNIRLQSYAYQMAAQEAERLLGIDMYNIPVNSPMARALDFMGSRDTLLYYPLVYATEDETFVQRLSSLMVLYSMVPGQGLDSLPAEWTTQDASCADRFMSGSLSECEWNCKVSTGTDASQGAAIGQGLFCDGDQKKVSSIVMSKYTSV
jgi:hypothetical protein